LNGFLDEAKGLCAHKIPTGDYSFTGNSLDIVLDIVEKNTKNTPNAEKTPHR